MQDQQTVPSSFGELLKTHRKRKRLTQKQLAQRLSVHANTISSWELVGQLPSSVALSNFPVVANGTNALWKDVACRGS